MDSVSDVAFIKATTDKRNRELAEAAELRAKNLQNKISKIEVTLRPSHTLRPKGSKNPRTDIRKYAGRKTRWIHIAKTPVRANIKDKMSEEFIRETDALAERMKGEGYKINDLSLLDDGSGSKGTTMNLGRKAMKRQAMALATALNAWRLANQDYALRLCRMK